MRRCNTSAWALDFTQPLSCPVCSATTPHTRSANILVAWGPPAPAWSLWKQDKSSASCLLLSFPLSQRLAPRVSGELCCRGPARSGGAQDDGLPSRGLYLTCTSASHTSPHRARVSHCSHTTPEWEHYRQAKWSSKRGFLGPPWWPGG